MLDVDSNDERVLADALARFGALPLVIRTAGDGGFHCYFKFSGEGRHIKNRFGQFTRNGAPPGGQSL